MFEYVWSYKVCINAFPFLLGLVSFGYCWPIQLRQYIFAENISMDGGNDEEDASRKKSDLFDV